jgi:hypothetical protein
MRRSLSSGDDDGANPSGYEGESLAGKLTFCRPALQQGAPQLRKSLVGRNGTEHRCIRCALPEPNHPVGSERARRESRD